MFHVEPIASYREVRMEGKRTFDLYADRLFVQGYVSLKSSFEVNLPLGVLNRVSSRVRTRNSMFMVGIGFFGVGSAFIIDPFDMHARPFSGVLALSLGLAGVVMILATVRKVEYAAIQNTAGTTVLMVARAGPDKARFDEFVAQLSARLREVGISGPASAA